MLAALRALRRAVTRHYNQCAQTLRIWKQSTGNLCRRICQASFHWKYAERTFAILTLVFLGGTLLVTVQTNCINVANNAALNRAFVFYKSRTFNDTIFTDTKEVTAWEIIPYWENSGNTPTKDLHFRIVCGVMAPPSNEETQFDWDAYDKESSHPHTQLEQSITRVLGPHQVDIGGSCRLTPDLMVKIQELIKPPYKFYIIGMATYYDVFDSVHQHVTRFCSKGEIVGDPKVDHGIDYVADYCPGKNNCADEECDVTGKKHSPSGSNGFWFWLRHKFGCTST